MSGRAAFDRDVLAILLLERAVALTKVKYDYKLSFRVCAMSVTSFCEELWIRQSSSYRTGFREESSFVRFWLFLSSFALFGLQLALRVLPAVTRLTVYLWLQIPVRIVSAQRRIRNNVWAGGL